MLRPRQTDHLGQLVHRHRRRQAPDQQPFENIGREIRGAYILAHDPADQTVGRLLHRSDVLKDRDLAALQPAPPRPRAPHGAQEMPARPGTADQRPGLIQSDRDMV